MNQSETIRSQFLKQLGKAFLEEELFDSIADTVFFVKDAKGRYVAANQTLVERLGLASRERLLGRTAAEVFPGLLGNRFTTQDETVLRSGKPLHGVLELHLYSAAGEGWCLTWKHPVRNANGRIIGLAGISRDLRPVTVSEPEMASLARALEHVQTHIEQPLRVHELAELAGLSVFQLDKRMRSLFGMSAGQYITRARIAEACNLLRNTQEPVSHVAQASGYGDQAAFTRAFRQSVGMTPRQYRVLRSVA